VTQDKEDTTATQIEEFAKIQFTDADIACVMRMSVADLKKKYAENIKRGQLLADADIYKSLYLLAKQGSTPAQKQWMDLVRKRKRANK
jgi:RNA polymerase-interacting CarD/CdnL/TRCF family regulator